MLANDDVNNIVLFSTEENFKFLAKCSIVLMNGAIRLKVIQSYSMKFLSFMGSKKIPMYLLFTFYTDGENGSRLQESAAEGKIFLTGLVQSKSSPH